MKTFLFAIFCALLVFSLSACYTETDYTDSNTSDVSETNTDSAVSTEARKDNATIMDSGFSAGNGTQTNPYMITTPEELVHFSEEINNGKLNNRVYFALGADIDMSGVEFSPIGNSSHPFVSHFDGRGHTVSNISPKLIYDDFGNNAIYSCGFFGIVGNAEIKNLCLENVNIAYTYESPCFTQIGILAAAVYPTRETIITDCIVNGNIEVNIDILLVGGIVGTISVAEDAKLIFERLQSKTKMIVISDSPSVGAVSGVVLLAGEETFSDICAQSEIIQGSQYGADIGAFGGGVNSKGCMSIRNCFFKINTTTQFRDNVHVLIGGIIDSYQPKGTFHFTNVFGFIDNCTELYEIPSENDVKKENCDFTEVLPANCNFNTDIWDITDLSAPFIKFNFKTN